MSPFFLLDYNSKIDFSPREIPRGVDVHLHRGFETVTIAYRGKIVHHDIFNNGTVEVVAGSLKMQKDQQIHLHQLKCTISICNKMER
jgi:redox-sensitive bicupin YhaK (pirin superfamily)